MEPPPFKYEKLQKNDCFIDYLSWQTIYSEPYISLLYYENLSNALPKPNQRTSENL